MAAFLRELAPILHEVESQSTTQGDWVNRGASFQAMGHAKEAVRCYSRAIELDPFAADAWSNKGISYEYLQKFEEALRCHEKAISIDPGNPRYWNNKGACLFLMGRYGEALECCDRALGINPLSAPALLEQGANTSPHESSGRRDSLTGA